MVPQPSAEEMRL